jgi:hypothetical protein
MKVDRAVQLYSLPIKPGNTEGTVSIDGGIAYTANAYLKKRKYHPPELYDLLGKDFLTLSNKEKMARLDRLCK